MSVLPVTYYVMRCDGCGSDADYGDYSAMSEASHAVEYGGDEWIEVGDKHFCDDCTVWSEDEDCFVPAPQNAAEVRSTDTESEKP